MPVDHPAAGALGVVAVALFVLTLGVDYGYVTSATVGGLSASALGFFVVLTVIIAVAVYAWEGTRARTFYPRRERE